MKRSTSDGFMTKTEEPLYHKDVLHEHWASNGKKPLVHEGKNYRVGKMSYGDYFLEPHNPKHPEGRGERDNGGMHRSDTKFLERHPEKKDFYQVGRAYRD